ncbi:MAG: WD40 repeat domain-containing protein [bacterium]
MRKAHLIPTLSCFVVVVSFSYLQAQFYSGSKKYDMLIRTLKGHENAIHTITFSPDGKLLASGGGANYEWRMSFTDEVRQNKYDTSIKIWDVRTGKIVQTLTGHPNIENYVKDLFFSYDGQYLVSIDYNTNVFVWDVASGRRLRTIVPEGDYKYFKSLALNRRSDIISLSNRSHILAARTKRKMSLIDIETGETFMTAKLISDVFTFSDDLSLAASWNSREKKLKLINLDTFDMKFIPILDNGLKELKFTPGGDKLIGHFVLKDEPSTRESKIIVWNVKTGARVNEFTRETHYSGLSLKAVGAELFVVTKENKAIVYDLEFLQPFHTFDEGPLRQSKKSWRKKYVGAVAINPAGDVLACESENLISLWRISKADEIKQKITLGSQIVNSASITNNSPVIAVADENGKIRFWNLSTHEKLQKSFSFAEPIHAISHSPDDKEIAVGFADGSLLLIDAETGRPIRTFEKKFHTIRSIKFSPRGQIIAAAGGKRDKHLRLFDIKTGKATRKFNGSKESDWAFDFSPDGWLLAGRDNSYYGIPLWNLNTGCRERVLQH